MDKQEYKILSEEIMTLVANEQFVEAVDIADRIDWRKVRSFTMLQRISDLYKINRRYDEALDILFLAYDKNPNSKTIVYGICELYLDLGDLITALQYMSIYNKMAPKDVGGAILKYKVLEMEEASYEDRVEQLEKICDMSYQAEWAYQLAYMYHRMGLGTKCVEVCDQLISWFGNGAFVIKAMELKMLHEKLTSYQQEVYDHRNDVEGELRAYEGEEDVPGYDGEDDFHVKTIDMSKFNTINLQKVLAESMRDLMGEEYNTQDLASTGRMTAGVPNPIPEESYSEENYSEEYYPEDNYAEENYSEENYSEEYYAPEGYEGEYSEEVNGEYPENYSDNYSGKYYPEDYSDYDKQTANIAATNNIATTNPDNSNLDSSNLAASNTANISAYNTQDMTAASQYVPVPDETAYIPAGQALAGGGETFFDDKTGDIVIDEVPLGMLNNLIPGVEFVATERTTAPINAPAVNEALTKTGAIEAGNIHTGNTSSISFAEKYATHDSQIHQNATPSKINMIDNSSKRLAFDNQLSYESDGQISLVVPSKVPAERQITGQMNIVDVLAEWERLKKRSIVRQDEEVRQNFLEKTGRIFADYDESKSDTIIAHIEQNKRKMDRVLPDKADKGFSATEALSKTYGVSIWDEVEKAIAADEAAAAMALGAGGAVLGGAIAAAAVEGAGSAAATNIAGEVAEDAASIAGSAIGAAGNAAGNIVGDIAETVIDGGVELVKAGVEPKKAITSEMKPDSLRLVESEDEISDKIVGQVEDTKSSVADDSPAEELGYEDEDGNFVVGDYDEDGNFMEYGYYDKDGNYFEYTGYYDADGNYIEYEYEDIPSEDLPSKDLSSEDADLSNENVENADNTNKETDKETDNEQTSESDAQSEKASESDNSEIENPETVDAETEGIESENIGTENPESESINEAGLETSEEDGLGEEGSEVEGSELEDSEVEDSELENAELENAELENAELADSENSEAIDEQAEESAGEYPEEYTEEYAEEPLEEYSDNMDTSEINNLGEALELAADETSAETIEDINDEYTLGDEERDFSEDEQTIFADYLYSKKMRTQILEAIDVISLASYVGNVIISGDAGANVLGLAKAMIKEIQLIDGNFSAGRVAKISGSKMNQKDIPGMLMQLANGALIIEKASKMNRSTLENLTMALENASEGIIVIISDTKPAIEKLIKNYDVITGYFNARIDIIPMSINALVEYAKKYAYSEEYKIDEETGVLALHERISDLQIGEHHVTVEEVEEIVDDAIARSKRPRLSTFIDILTAKRYDYEDMIILKEKDFRA